MFYSHLIFVRDGPISKIWLAAHVLRQLKAKDITALDITKGAAVVMNGESKEGTPFALRICGQLLYGLTRIYQKKVELVSDEAKTIQHKLDSLHKHGHSDELEVEEKAGYAAAPGTPARAARKSRIELDATELRARDAQITLHDKHNPYDDVDAYANLGAGGFDDIELMDSSMLDAFVTKEWKDDISILGTPLGQFDSQSGILQLAGGNVQLVDDNVELMDIDQQPLVDDGEAGIGIDDEARDVSHLSDGRDESRIAEGRATDKSVAPGFDLSTSILPTDGTTLKGLTSQYDDQEFGAGGDGALVGDDFGQHLSPGPSRPGSIAAGEDEVDIDAELEARQAELRALKLAQSKKANQKRKIAPYQSVIDDVTEVSRDDVRRWLSDPSDIMREKEDRLLRSISMSNNLEALTESHRHQHIADHHAHGHGAHGRTGPHLFDHLSTGTGHAASQRLTSLTRRLVAAGEVGRFANKLMELMEERFNCESHVPGLPYDAKLDTTVGPADAARNASALGEDVPAGVDLSGIGMDDLSFGNFAIGGEDSFTQEGADGAGGALLDDESMEIIGEEAIDDLVPITGEPPVDGDELYNVDDFNTTSTDDAAQSRRRDAEVRDWWSESERASASGSQQRPSGDSAFTQRTNKMLSILMDHYTPPQPLPFSTLLDGKVRAIAAGSFYQLLILASRGQIAIDQQEQFGEINITIDGKKKAPTTTSATGRGKKRGKQQAVEEDQPIESQMSELY